MTYRLDQILVIDVEATCWDGPPPPGQHREIIEIGIALLDLRSGERTLRERLLVRPKTALVSDYCTELTGLTQTEVSKGLSLARACSRLRKQYASSERLWASFGDFDRRLFDLQCRQHGVKYPFSPNHLNIKSLFAARHLPTDDLGLIHCMTHLNLPVEGQHHRAVDDAWNAAALLADLLHSPPVAIGAAAWNGIGNA